MNDLYEKLCNNCTKQYHHCIVCCSFTGELTSVHIEVQALVIDAAADNDNKDNDNDGDD